MSNSDPSAIVLHGIPCIGGLYISLDSNGENGSLFALRSSFAAIHTKPRRSVLLRVPDLQYDLAGLVGCARKHALRLARFRKRQD